MRCGTCSLFICPNQIPHTTKTVYSGHFDKKKCGEEKFRSVLFGVYEKHIKNRNKICFCFSFQFPPTALSNRNRIDRISSYVIYESKVIFLYMRFFIKSNRRWGNQILSPSGRAWENYLLRTFAAEWALNHLHFTGNMREKREGFEGTGINLFKVHYNIECLGRKF